MSNLKLFIEIGCGKVKIKKYEAQTEQAAIEMVRDELGMDAIVLNIKKIQPKGIFAFFRKPVVEITAAYEERAVAAKNSAVKMNAEPISMTDVQERTLAAKLKTKEASSDKAPFAIPKPVDTTSGKQKANEEKLADSGDKNETGSDNGSDSDISFIMKEITISEQQIKIRDLENQLQSTEQTLSKMSKQLLSSVQKAKYGQRKYNAPIIQMFYDILTEHGVLTEICEEILDEIDLVSDIEEIDVNIIVKIIYNSLISMIVGNDPPQPERIDKKLTKASVYAFVGSTGVGKTTTVAKLAAEYMLNQGLNVGLITADTYRIAAVEQLKLYADILGIEVCVVYNTNELAEYVELLSGINDVILIDTAGRSPKNGEAIDDLETLLKFAPDCQVFLVLSLTTKYEDLMSIIETYAKIADFKLVFTKWDETVRMGAILNIIYKTGKKIAYITNGQNVPQDLETVQPEKIAKALLGIGLGEE